MNLDHFLHLIQNYNNGFNSLNSLSTNDEIDGKRKEANQSESDQEMKVPQLTNECSIKMKITKKKEF